jgi:hypothetical protein
MLVIIMALPAIAAEEVESMGASVSVGETVSISLVDAGGTGHEGIRFGSVQPDGNTYGDTDQTNGTPAIKVKVENETNVSVDISIMGSTAGSLSLTNWKYSKLFDKSDIASLTGSYIEVYDSAAKGSENAFYHWITVPVGTTSGSYSATVNYKAATHT